MDFSKFFGPPTPAGPVGNPVQLGLLQPCQGETYSLSLLEFHTTLHIIHTSGFIFLALGGLVGVLSLGGAMQEVAG